jgi:hypothetical protein
MSNRYKCVQCDNICQEGEVLHSQNPFDITEAIVGCPLCKSVDSLVTACEVPDCTREASCGWPSPTGFHVTCGQHMEHNK